MSNRIHALAQQLTGKQYLEDCSLEEVKQIAQRYPYFAPAQFLLLQKLRLAGTAEEVDAQYKKAVLFYPDPLQFEFFISSAKFYEEVAEAPQREISTLPVLEEGHGIDLLENEPTETPEFVEEEEPQNLLDVPPAETNEEDDSEDDDQAASLEPEENIVIASDQNNAIAEDLQESNDSQDKLVPETDVIQSLTEAVKESPQTTSPFAFEPYHTVDYFASQGIKISSDELPKDKLGKQLKSFTEWLKTMKRLPAAQLAESSKTTVEKGVETLADRSVSDSEVLTEAMAEVWVKQGAPQKALDIYNKLLLHDPSKKAYFAAKIKNLKQF